MGNEETPATSLIEDAEATLRLALDGLRDELRDYYVDGAGDRVARLTTAASGLTQIYTTLRSRS